MAAKNDVAPGGMKKHNFISKLHNLAALGNVDRVRRMLQHDLGSRWATGHGSWFGTDNITCIAARHGHRVLVQFLRQVDFLSSSLDHSRAFGQAASNGHWELCCDLLDPLGVPRDEWRAEWRRDAVPRKKGPRFITFPPPDGYDAPRPFPTASGNGHTLVISQRDEVLRGLRHGKLTHDPLCWWWIAAKRSGGPASVGWDAADLAVARWLSHKERGVPFAATIERLNSANAAAVEHLIEAGLLEALLRVHAGCSPELLRDILHAFCVPVAVLPRDVVAVVATYQFDVRDVMRHVMPTAGNAGLVVRAA